MYHYVTYINTKWEQIQCRIKNTAFHWGLSIFCCCNFHHRQKAQKKKSRPLQRKTLRAAQFSGGPLHAAAANHVFQWSLMNIKTANYTTWQHTSAPVRINSPLFGPSSGQSVQLDQIILQNTRCVIILDVYFRFRFAIGAIASFTGRTNLLVKQMLGMSSSCLQLSQPGAGAFPSQS